MLMALVARDQGPAHCGKTRRPGGARQLRVPFLALEPETDCTMGGQSQNHWELFSRDNVLNR
jgi:hypothetical protein